MKTDDLISLLSTGESGGGARTTAQRYGLALGGSAFLAALLTALFLGVRPDITSAMTNPMFWLKFGFCAALLAGGLVASMRLAQPGVPVRFTIWIIAVPALIIWIVAAVVLMNAPPSQRVALALGETWSRCPWLIAGLSMPSLFAFVWTMRDLAPTRPRLAGAAAGLLAGALAATVYCLHCPEMAAPFVAIWYPLGILIPTLIGYLLGRSVLGW